MLKALRKIPRSKLSYLYCDLNCESQKMNPQTHFYDPEDKKRFCYYGKCFQFKLVKLAQTNM